MKWTKEICDRLLTSQLLQDKLACYNGAAAIFGLSIPENDDPQWRDNERFPHIQIITVERWDAKQRSAGIAVVKLYSNSGDIDSDLIEHEVLSMLGAAFFAPENQMPYALKWMPWQPEPGAALKLGVPQVVQPQGIQSEEILCRKIKFEVYAFSDQVTTDPDPVLAVYDFLKGWMPELEIIGNERDGRHDALCDDSPTIHDEKPKCYLRLSRMKRAEDPTVNVNSVVWMDSVIAVHVFDSNGKSLPIIKSIADAIALKGEIAMRDGSPMLIKQVTVNSTADPFVYGQLRIHGQFGLLKKPEYVHRLMQVNYSSGG